MSLHISARKQIGSFSSQHHNPLQHQPSQFRLEKSVWDFLSSPPVSGSLSIIATNWLSKLLKHILVFRHSRVSHKTALHLSPAHMEYVDGYRSVQALELQPVACDVMSYACDSELPLQSEAALSW